MTQYHFTSWPDHGVPEHVGPILNYVKKIKADSNKGPTLVHCRFRNLYHIVNMINFIERKNYSAGVGRTGTLIAIDIALAQASKERLVDIPKIIVEMRKQRMKMVQTAVSGKF